MFVYVPSLLSPSGGCNNVTKQISSKTMVLGLVDSGEVVDSLCRAVIFSLAEWAKTVQVPWPSLFEGIGVATNV